MQRTVKIDTTKTILISALALVAVFAFNNTYAQQKKRVIQLSGVVVEEDSVAGHPVPGVHVFVPKAGYGRTTNNVGFFSLPVLVGDEVVISSIGYQRQYYTIPEDAPEYLTIVITLVPDSTLLPEVVIVPFPTEEVFKQAVLALNVPTEDQSIDRRNMNEELLALMLKTTPMDGYQNQRYYLNQWASSGSDKFQPVTNPFLNPFNWVKFFNSLKKNKKK